MRNTSYIRWTVSTSSLLWSHRSTHHHPWSLYLISSWQNVQTPRFHRAIYCSCSAVSVSLITTNLKELVLMSFGYSQASSHGRGISSVERGASTGPMDRSKESAHSYKVNNLGIRFLEAPVLDEFTRRSVLDVTPSSKVSTQAEAHEPAHSNHLS